MSMKFVFRLDTMVLDETDRNAIECYLLGNCNLYHVAKMLGTNEEDVLKRLGTILTLSDIQEKGEEE